MKTDDFCAIRWCGVLTPLPQNVCDIYLQARVKQQASRAKKYKKISAVIRNDGNVERTDD